MEKFNRAVRRHHNARLKRVRYRYWGGDRWEHTARQLGMLLNTPHPCSNSCCGNARRLYGRTLPELLQIIDLNAEE